MTILATTIARCSACGPDDVGKEGQVVGADCPDGNACIQENGGICVLACTDASDCRDGYNCVEKSMLNPAGSARVCLLQ